MDAQNLTELKQFIDECKSKPSILDDPSLAFFKRYLQRLGAKVPTRCKTENEDSAALDKEATPDDEYESTIVESDIELDNSDVVEPDSDPPQQIGDPSIEVSEESADLAQSLKANALDDLSQGKTDEAIDQLTKAITLNPRSAILYATRANVFVKLKKPNAAIRDANEALKINPDSAKGYKVRGMARAMLGHWEEAADDLHVAAKLDFDEEIASFLKKVEMNSQKVVEHRRKYERLRKEKEMKRIEREKQQQRIRTEKEAKSALTEGQVMGIHSASELDAKLKAASKLSRLVILYFTATWCGPCRQISPVFTTLAGKYRNAVFIKIDIDKAEEVASQWNISSVPAFFFVKNGRKVDELVGADKNSLESKIAQYA